MLDHVVTELCSQLSHDLGLTVSFELHHERASVVFYQVAMKPHTLLHTLHGYQPTPADVLFKRVLSHVKSETIRVCQYSFKYGGYLTSLQNLSNLDPVQYSLAANLFQLV